MLFFRIFLLTISCAPCLFAQNKTLAYDSIKGSPKATLQEIAWIAGHWKGNAMGGSIEEIWTAPAGKAMMGSFRLIEGDNTIFYELCTITEENGTLLLRIKHFSPELKGWEEKDKSIGFKLVKMMPNKAFFNGLTFERISKKELNIYVVIHKKDGTTQEMKFPYKKQ